MSVNSKKFLSVSVNSTGKRQADLETPIADTDFDKRIKVEVEVEDVVTTEDERDCSDVDLVDKTVESTLKKATWTFSRVTPFWIAYFTAFLLSAASEPETASGREKHTLTRSLSDDLAAFGFVECFEDDPATAEKYIGFKVESITLNLNRRKNVTMTMTTVGRFGTAAVANFDLPECETLPALKGSQCKLLIGGVDYTNLLWQLGLTLSNNMPTGDDAFPFVGQEIQTLERGKQPGYSISPQLLIRKGHTVQTAAKNRAKLPVVLQFGETASEHVVFTFPNTYLELNAKWRQFVGELEQYSTVIDATPMKDDTLGTPIKVEAFLDQSEQFLLT